MNLSVWVITSRTRGEMDTAVSSGSETGLVDELTTEADTICARFHEANHQERDNTTPPSRYDLRTIGGLWSGNICPGTGREFNTCREASELPAERLPRIIVSPSGYAASAPTPEEKPEIRRILRHWPDNVAIAIDWHY